MKHSKYSGFKCKRGMMLTDDRQLNGVPIATYRPEITIDTRTRLELMTSTTDGFVIAEADMRLRGPGDIEGTMQSGMPFDLKVANLATDGVVIQAARDLVDEILDADPDLIHPDNAILPRQLALLTSRSFDWSRIS